MTQIKIQPKAEDRVSKSDRYKAFDDLGIDQEIIFKGTDREIVNAQQVALRRSDGNKLFRTKKENGHLIIWREK